MPLSPVRLHPPRADLAEKSPCTFRESVIAPPIDATPRLPHISHKYPGQQIVHNSGPFEKSKTDNRDEHAANNLIGIFCRRGRRIGQNNKCEKERGLKVWRAEYFGYPPGISHKRHDSEQKKISSQKGQHEGNLVDSVRDEDARGEQHQPRGQRNFRERPHQL